MTSAAGGEPPGLLTRVAHVESDNFYGQCTATGVEDGRVPALWAHHRQRSHPIERRVQLERDLHVRITRAATRRDRYPSRQIVSILDDAVAGDWHLSWPYSAKLSRRLRDVRLATHIWTDPGDGL